MDTSTQIVTKTKFIRDKIYRFPYNVQSAKTDPPALMEEGRPCMECYTRTMMLAPCMAMKHSLELTEPGCVEG